MKKIGIVGLLFFVSTAHTVTPKNTTLNLKGAPFSDFWSTKKQLEQSGGRDPVSQEKLCGLGVVCLNALREQVLLASPALQQRKTRAEISLSRASRELSLKTQDNKNPKKKDAKQKDNQLSKTAAQLQREIKDARYELEEIEDEVEAQLHARADLSEVFDKIHAALQEWCD